jgi:hypothetical protein
MVWAGILVAIFVVCDAYRTTQFFSAYQEIEKEIEMMRQTYISRAEIVVLPRENLDRIESLGEQVDLIRSSLERISSNLSLYMKQNEVK